MESDKIMARYHVRADGSMGVCTAKEGNCPFGGESGTRHFTNKSEAQAYSEERIKAVEAGKSLGGGFRKNLKDSKTLSGRVPSTGKRYNPSGGEDFRTAKVNVSAVEGLNPTYDPGEYDAEDAERLYEADLTIMEQAEGNVRAYRNSIGVSDGDVMNYENMGVDDYAPLYAQDSRGQGTVLPLPKQVREDFKTAIGYVNQGVETMDKDLSGEHESDEEFSTYFAEPESYVMVSDTTGKVDLSGFTRKLDPDSAEADEILSSGSYIDVADAFAEYKQGMRFTESEDEELFEDFGRGDGLSMNKRQLNAIYWAMKRYPNSSKAIVRHEEDIFVLR